VRVVGVADKLSSGWYRVHQPIAALQAQGVDASVAELGMPTDLSVNADVVVLLRPTMWFAADLIRTLQARGVRVVVDIDDDFHSVHPLNRAFDENHPRLQPHANFHHFRAAVKVADLVTVSTPALARRYGSHGRVAVLRNCVTGSWLGIPNRGDGRTVGWAGAISNHPTDLEVTHGGVATAVNECDARFLCVGGGVFDAKVKRQLGFEEIEATPWRDLELHPYLVARLDVGIAPLTSTRFNEAKSALKGMEYAALGIPFVASPVAEYRWLQDHYGLGLLASDRARDWRRKVKQLLTNDTYRRELGEHHRQIVRNELVIERNAWRWAEAWESTLTRAAA
jgi:glycosyltransferase involved in cell wall biosynthesis